MVARLLLFVPLVLLLPHAYRNAGQDTEPVPTPRGSRATVEVFSTELDGGAGGLEVDAEGNVYCADFGAALGGGPPGTRVYRLDPDGIETVWATGFRGASGNAIGPDGSFFQSNIGASTISRIAPDGEHTEFLNEMLRSPVGIVIDAEGTLFVANCGSAQIVEVSPEGEAQLFAGGPLLSCPNGITIDPEHNLYVCNFNNGDVLKIDLFGAISRLATLPGNNNGHLTYHEGALYVVARSAHQIYRVTPRRRGRAVRRHR